MTRMWNVDTSLLCDRHLLGEHKELHQLVGSLLKGKSVKGHLDRGQVEIHTINKRHEEVVNEIEKRGFNHKSPLPKFNSYSAGRIDTEFNIRDLIERCKDCRLRINRLIKNKNELKRIS